MFIRSTLAFGLVMAMQSAPVAAQGLTALMQAPPPAPFAKVSELDALPDGTAFDDLAIGSHDGASVDIYYNAGHPGVAAGWQDAAPSSGDLPEVARTSVPSVDAILVHGQVLAQAAP